MIKRENRLFLSGIEIDKTNLGFSSILLDFHYKAWLGDKRIKKIDIQELDDNVLQFELYRTYGDTYVERKYRTQYRDTGFMYCYDYALILGLGKTDGNADLTKIEGDFVHYLSGDDLWNEYKKMAKKKKCIVPERMELDDDKEKLTIKLFFKD